MRFSASPLLALILMGGVLPLSHATAPGGIPPLLQIGVEVVEVNERKSRQLGVDWINLLHVEETDVPSVFSVGGFTRSKIFADLQLLVNEGAADLLANPKLVARDSTTAVFQAGGELPYATSSSLGSANVEFKPYGVNLKINPHLEDNGHIAMSVDAEVSGPDEDRSVLLAGNKVPGIRSRRVSSQLTLSPGTTLTMAGLIQTQKQTTRQGVPGLMHIPVLRYLFSHEVATRERTSIVVFVTPIVLEPTELRPSTPAPSIMPGGAASKAPPVPARDTDDLLSHLES